jgi:transcriptional regulator with XRE-family HTH domain
MTPEDLSINARIRQVRHSVELPQTKFSKRIAIAPNYLAEIEVGKKRANERVIRLVSLEFGVDEHWLRTGEGEMCGDIAAGRNAKVITLFRSMTPAFQEYAMDQLGKLVELCASLKNA